MTTRHTKNDPAPATAQRVPTPPKAWLMLALGVGAQTSGTAFVSAPAFLIPELHTQLGIPLAQAGLLATAPTIGMVFTLIAWGALADRIGERWVISGGLALTTLAALGAVVIPGYVSLGVFGLLGGAAAASTNVASGRVVVGWFPRDRRGLAMGIRQMAQPFGVTIAAMTVPTTAAAYGPAAAMILPTALCGVIAVLSARWIENPPRSAPSSGPAADEATNPYRSGSFLWRIHAVSVLLVVPQFTLSTFGLVWLMADAGMDSVAAGAVVGGAQVVGALGRIVVGGWSDRLGSRVRLLRWVAAAAAATMVLAAVTDIASIRAAAAVAFVVASIVSVADNGLAFTSVAEAAGPRWSGAALGAQNTGQFLAASGVGPAVGALIATVGYPLAFCLVAIAPLAAVPLVPARDIHAE
ncbi:MFS transporter [Sinomonas sp. ASV322]|uniref:MFS transporter n=1 Tax=Sinomonas sp. ASV322 TaxID=3041920 RepID=UPI0027DDD764|nr:MFS transporter [Sinomonas sp. ASV322]MDQ4503412.1 MFS transporter [Sinomonas sp. ASV322]